MVGCVHLATVGTDVYHNAFIIIFKKEEVWYRFCQFLVLIFLLSDNDRLEGMVDTACPSHMHFFLAAESVEYNNGLTLEKLAFDICVFIFCVIFVYGMELE